MTRNNFERITRKAPTEGFTGRKGAKLNKRNRSADRADKREAFEHEVKEATMRFTKSGNRNHAE